MVPSQQCVDLIMGCEKFSPELYNDPDNDCTIGYGHLVHLGRCCGAPSEQPFLQGIDQAAAGQLLKQDAAIVGEQVIAALGQTAISQGEFDALVDFTYNEGIGRLEGSTLLLFVKENNPAAAAAQFGRWVYGKGRVLPGLVTRRQEEVNLYVAGAAARLGVSPDELLPKTLQKSA